MQKPNRKIIRISLKDKFLFWNNYYINSKKKDSLVKIPGFEISLKSINNVITRTSFTINNKIDTFINNSFYYKNLFIRNENFYIIDKNTDSTFGPMSLKEFEFLMKKKHIKLSF